VRLCGHFVATTNHLDKLPTPELEVYILVITEH
jgi:hypothetical protein